MYSGSSRHMLCPLATRLMLPLVIFLRQVGHNKGPPPCTRVVTQLSQKKCPQANICRPGTPASVGGLHNSRRSPGCNGGNDGLCNGSGASLNLTRTMLQHQLYGSKLLLDSATSNSSTEPTCRMSPKGDRQMPQVSESGLWDSASSGNAPAADEMGDPPPVRSI